MYRRTQPLPWPGSRLSFVPNGAKVTAADTVDIRHQRVDLSATGNGGQAVFAMLGWPGWHATFAGHDVHVGRDSAGLLTVTLPPDAAGRLELTYTPPGLTASLAAGGLGLLGALALGWFGRRRKERVDEVADDEEPAEAEADEAGA